mmetsp:Transcript_83683/g.217850  ORF Transcript_83683/g.217850 Transcript_83683/m.217850 type:complete len:102 (+) Transcript_83683:401-706(+)
MSPAAWGTASMVPAESSPLTLTLTLTWSCWQSEIIKAAMRVKRREKIVPQGWHAKQCLFSRAPSNAWAANTSIRLNILAGEDRFVSGVEFNAWCLEPKHLS